MIKIKTLVSSHDWDSLPRIQAQNPAGLEVRLAVGNGAESLEVCGRSMKTQALNTPHTLVFRRWAPGASGKCRAVSLTSSLDSKNG